MERPRVDRWGGLLLILAGSVRAEGPPVEVKVKSISPDGSAGGSVFLRPPGVERYGPEVDWREVPPWQQTSFFGIRAKGKVFIYVVDRSGSMAGGGRLVRAKQEIRRSVVEMRFPQRFQVIFYNDRPLTLSGGLPMSADVAAKDQLFTWLRLVEPDGETDPRGALAQAVALKPDAVFLLSDGVFPDGTAATIARQNAGKVPIHCIDLAGGPEAEQLRQIARDSGGQYAVRAD